MPLATCSYKDCACLSIAHEELLDHLPLSPSVKFTFSYRYLDKEGRFESHLCLNKFDQR